MKTVLTTLLAICLCVPLMADEQKDKEFFEKVKAAAEKGRPDAQSVLGNLYLEGKGVQKNLKEAVKWWRKAADQGNASAQYFLGWAYGYGEGVPEDDKEAVKWYQKVAEQGHVRAQSALGFMYKNGEGVPEDYATAYAWWNIAQANGHEIAKEPKFRLAKKMTAEQITKVEALSKEMIKKNPKLIQKKE